MVIRDIDWGKATHSTQFYGRSKELARIQQWITNDACRLLTIIGKGGVGKTSLAMTVVDAVQEQFEYVFCRSLQFNADRKIMLQDCIHFLSHQSQGEVPENEEQQISLLITYLQQHRCLLIFDNLESIMGTGSDASSYLEGFGKYNSLFKRLGEVEHQSCILLTSREQPRELVSLEEEIPFVRSYRLAGLDIRDGRDLLNDKGLTGEEKTRDALVEHYAGNPLALKLISPLIQESFDGDISKFLDEEKHISTDLYAVLNQQFARLSSLERDALYWLAIERESTSTQILREDVIQVSQKKNVQESLSLLRRRDLIEKNEQGFVLQNVILEYVTEKLVEQIVQEIDTQAPKVLTSHVLVKAQTKDYVRESQARFLRKPIVDLLVERYGKAGTEKKLKALLSVLRQTDAQKPSYAAGNILNLLVALKADLRGYDFSQLAMYQAYLQDVDLPEVQFVGSTFEKSVFIDVIGITLSVAFDPEGELLAVGTANSEIRLWQAKDTKPLQTFFGHHDWVWAIAFRPHSNILASGSGDKTVRLWDIHSGQCLKVLTGQNTWFPSVAFTPDGSILAAGGDDHSIRLWSVVSTNQSLEIQALKTLEGHTDRVWSVAFSPDGQVLASGSADSTIRLWDVSSGKCLKILSGQAYPIRSVAFAPQGDILASASGDKHVQLWDIHSGQRIQTFEGHTDWLRTVAFSADGQVLASAGEDRTIRLWDIASGECLKVLQGHTNRVRSVAFRSGSQVLVSGGEDQTIRLWDRDAGQCVKTLHGYAHPIWTVAFSPDGNILASISEDHLVVRLQLWDTDSGRLLKSLQGYTHRVRSIAFSPNGTTLATGCEDRTVRTWKIHDTNSAKVLQGHTDRVWSVSYSFDGAILASGSEDKTIRLWNAKTDEHIRTLVGHARQIWTVAFSPKENVLASGGEDHTIRFWNASTGECIQVLQGHEDGVWSVAFSPDGNILASGSEDHTIRLWNIATGECLKVLQGHESRVWSVAFSHDGSILASSGEDMLVRLWDVSTGQCVNILHGHKKQIRSLTSHPRSLLFASGSDDGTVMFWDGQTGKCIKTLTSNKPYEHMNITDVMGLEDAQKEVLKALGAIDTKDTPHLKSPDTLPSVPRKHVFISYSHKDKKWLERFQTALAPLIRGETVRVWADTQIKPGTHWQEEISKALAAAKVALLLVTPDFLASDFIAKHELPPLLEAAKQEGLIILWVAVRESLYEHTEIAIYQSVNDPSKPLKSLSPSKLDGEVKRICKVILDSMNS